MYAHLENCRSQADEVTPIEGAFGRRDALEVGVDAYLGLTSLHTMMMAVRGQAKLTMSLSAPERASESESEN